MDQKQRYEFFGKCCWTCENTDCQLSWINKQPPHESNEGRLCDSYVSKMVDKSTKIAHNQAQ